jgi:hypothetical protein
MKRIQDTKTADESASAADSNTSGLILLSYRFYILRQSLMFFVLAHIVSFSYSKKSNQSSSTGINEGLMLQKAQESYVIFSIFLSEIVKCCGNISVSYCEQLISNLLLLFATNNEEIVTIRIIFRQRLEDTVQSLMKSNDKSKGVKDSESKLHKLGKELLEILKPDDLFLVHK